MTTLNSLYREELLWASQNMSNKKSMAKPTIKMRQVNPLCGDEITLMIKIEKTKVCDVTFEGSGCLISQVSASILGKSLVGLTIQEASKVTDKKLLSLLKIDPTPARLKCALLSLWTLREALNSHGQTK